VSGAARLPPELFPNPDSFDADTLFCTLAQNASEQRLAGPSTFLLKFLVFGLIFCLRFDMLRSRKAAQ